jgi:hypothetical protein
MLLFNSTNSLIGSKTSLTRKNNKVPQKNRKRTKRPVVSNRLKCSNEVTEMYASMEIETLINTPLISLFCKNLILKDRMFLIND